MEQSKIEIKAKFVRGFSDKTRLQILDCIRQSEKTVSQIVSELGGNQSNISQHLTCLKDCGIIVCRQEGKYMYYSLRNEQILQLLDAIETVFNQLKEEAAACDRIEESESCGSRKGDNQDE